MQTDIESYPYVLLGAGCFWGVQLSFSQLEGVVETEVGYAGGHTQAPNYEQVCRGDTMHAEVVKVSYDPGRINLEALLRHFFTMHDPTTLNRQGPDVGTQYRSVIFFLDASGKEIAQRIIAEAQQQSSREIVTTLEPMAVFWRAEEYHQHYFKKRGIRNGCH